MNTKQPRKFLKYWPVLLFLVALAASGLAYAFWPQSTTVTSTKTSSSRSTGAAQVVSVAGTGKLEAGRTADLAFPLSGRVAALTVQAGDLVTAGQALASLENTNALTLQVTDDELAVQTAQNALDELQNNTAGALAQAELDVVNAKKALEDAQNNLRTPGEGRCESSVTQQYYFDWLDAQKEVDAWEPYLDDPNTGYGRDYLIQVLTPLWQKRNTALANWNYCQTFTQQEIDDSRAALQTAQTNLTTTQAKLETLKANNGVDPDALALAKATLESAKARLAKDQQTLQNATLTAPFDGLVTSVKTKVGQMSGTGAVISIADLTKPQVRANFDETDLGGVALNCQTEITFSTDTSKTYQGTITQILPQLVSTNSVNSVQVVISLGADAQNVSLGASASVVAACGE